MKRAALFLLAIAAIALAPTAALAQTAAEESAGSSQLLRTGFLITLLAIAPAMFVSMTSFIRIAIVLAMVRHAFGMPETPPNIVLVSLAALLTAFVMGPTFGQINTIALQPLMADEITVEAAIERGGAPLRDFMLAQTRDDDIAAIYSISGDPPPLDAASVDIMKLAPAFILNELRVSFTIGFIILLPFLLIELIVASVLLALGMMMVPPATISLPIKLLMFVIIDGWALVIEGVIGGFR